MSGTSRRAAPRNRAPRRRGFKNWLRDLVIVAVVTAGGIYALVWWQDRPLNAIEAALTRSDFNSAQTLSTEYLAANPMRSDAMELKARALAGLKRWPDAARLFDRAGAVTPDGQRAYSQSLLHLRRWSDALPLLVALHQARPEDADILHELAACSGQLGEQEEAVKYATKLLTIPGHEARSRLLLGTLQDNVGNHRLAVEAWTPILKISPDATDLQVTPAEFFYALGKALLNDGRAAEAVTPLRRSMKAEPSARAAGALGEALEQAGELKEAEQAWREALQLDPQDLKSREGLARMVLARSAPAEALEWLSPMASRSKLPSATAYLFQRTYTMLGEKARAAEWEERVSKARTEEQRMNLLETGLRQAPHSFWSRAIRAHRFASQGNTLQAQAIVAGLLRESPQEPFVQKLADALQHDGELPSLEMVPINPL